MSPGLFFERPAGVTAEHIISVSQIVDGDARCYCGAGAVLIVETSPDGDPGATCYAHALERILFTNNIIGNLFGTAARETAA